MPIIVTCSGCSARMNAPDDSGGKRVKCPKCAMLLTVPQSEPPPVAASAPAPGGALVTERAAPPARRSEHDEEEELRSRHRGRDEDDDRRERSSRRRDEDEEDEDEDFRRPVQQPNSGGAALGLGIASLVCAIIALPVALFPCTSVFSLVLSGVALVLGLVGFTIAAMKQWHGVAFPIAGTVVSLLAITITALWIFLFAGAFVSAKKGIDQTQQAFQEAQRQNEINRAAAAQAQRDNEARERARWLAQGYVDASNTTFKVPNVAEVRIVSLRTDTVNFERPAPGQRFNRYLQIVVEVNNTSKGNLEYKSPSQSVPGNARVTLIDHANRRIDLASFGPVDVPGIVGQQRNVAILPGQRVNDLLVFDPPILGANYLRLELPGAAIGQPGQTLRFFIPKAMIPR